MTVSLVIGGIAYGGWEDISITRSIESLSGSFDIAVSERWPGQTVSRAIHPGDPCQVRIDGDTVITGYVDDVNASFDSESHTLQITGRDKAGDLVDCSAINRPGQWSGLRFESIVQELIAPFGLSVSVETDTGEAFKKFNIQQGETAYETIERMAKMRALLVVSDGLGNLVITRAGNGKSATALVQGQNILAASSKNSMAERFSQYLCKGQDQGNDTHPASVFTQPKGSAIDADVSRYRPMLVMAEGKATSKICQDRAAWERSVRIGKALTATVTVAKWRQGDDGPLWQPNTKTIVNIPALKLVEQMLIAEVTYSLSTNEGSTTQLSLVRPAAYQLIPEAAQV
jgi:prophage tail gpP-like protein